MPVRLLDTTVDMRLMFSGFFAYLAKLCLVISEGVGVEIGPESPGAGTREKADEKLHIGAKATTPRAVSARATRCAGNGKGARRSLAVLRPSTPPL